MWENKGKGVITISSRQQLIADEPTLSRGTYFIYIPDGKTFSVGYKNIGGTFFPVSDDYVATASSGRACLCKIRIRLRPTIITHSSGIALAPKRLPSTSERYTEGIVWLSNGTKITPAVKIDNDIIELSDQITGIAAKGGTKCKMSVKIKLIPDKQIPPEPPVGPES